MVNTGLRKGPYPRGGIDVHVIPGNSIGVYVWGKINPSNQKLVVQYVGRSDDHEGGLNSRLHGYDRDHPNWTHFKFDYFKTSKAAFERESQIWHDFGLDKEQSHPRLPEGAAYPCPVGGTNCFEQ